MQIVRDVKSMQQIALDYKKSGKTIGFVPTMGFLHEGHTSLLSAARSENDVVILSVFVNPLQFGPNEDYSSYPRDFTRDEKIAKEANVDIIFYPETKTMYPETMSVALKVTDRVNVLCGKSRPGHFDGVVTVLTKLFNIILPDRAYFGMKDAQQVAVIEGLVDDHNIPVQIVRCPIIREEDGLAKSSRNVRLTEKERLEAVEINRALQATLQEINAGAYDVSELKNKIIKNIEEKTSGMIDYVEILSYPNLVAVEKIASTCIVAVAVKFSTVRLIDNVIVSL